MALYGRGFPISPHTVAKKLGIENFGEIPGDTEFEKWVNWKKIEIMLLAQSQELAGALGIGGPAPPGGGGNAQTQAGVQHAGGRPPVDAQPGKMVVKDKETNPRPVIKTTR